MGAVGAVLETGLERREATAEIIRLEKREAELWQRYRELDRRTAELKDSGNRELYKLTKKDTLRANRKHQRCVDLILRIHRDRLFEGVRG